MSDVAVFDYPIWANIYPELAPVDVQTQAQHWFNVACQYINNTACSPIPMTDGAGNPVRIVILGMVTAHLMKLFGPGSQDVVGRVASAGQGSVNVTLDMGPQSQSGAWWNQTRYGAAAWQMLLPYRLGGRLFLSSRPYLGVGSPGGGFAPGAWPGLRGTSYKGGNPWGIA